MNKTAKRFLSGGLAALLCLAPAPQAAFAQGGEFEYEISVTVKENPLGGTLEEVTYLTQGAEVVLDLALPADSNLYSGEIWIEYDPEAFSAAVDTGVNKVTEIGDLIDTSESEPNALVRAEMSDEENQLASVMFVTGDGDAINQAGTFCRMTFTCLTETGGLSSPEEALSKTLRVIYTRAIEDDGSEFGEDIGMDGADYRINEMLSGFRLGEPVEVLREVILFDYNGDKMLDSIDLAYFKRILSGTLETTATRLRMGDYNGDGELDSIDYAVLKRCLTTGDTIRIEISE